MKRYCLYSVLSLSLLLNIVTAATVGYRWIVTAQTSTESAAGTYLADTLDLDAQQRQAWRAKSSEFTRQIDAHWREARLHQEKMIREIFAKASDPDVIEAERKAILVLQDRMQQLVIEHMRDERAMLDSSQRDRLVQLLIEHRRDTHWPVPHND